jgi:hypothetical protein
VRNRVEKALREAPANVRRFVREACGEQVGYGIHRDVYVFGPDPRYVAKVERIYDMDDDPDFANVCEWRNWQNCREWLEFSRWLAPCAGITQNGLILIQRRIRHRAPGVYPERVPSLFTDLKYANFGWIGRRFVCCDYPFLRLGYQYRLRRAKWWGDDPRRLYADRAGV